MRHYRVLPQPCVAGEIFVPGDKSISHRALLMLSIAEGLSEVAGFLESEDCLATLTAMRALGVRIERPTATTLSIHGAGLFGLAPAAGPLDMGNAGTAMRLATGLLAAQPFASRLIGDASLMRRPMERVAKPLRTMGAQVLTRQGTPPIEVHGVRPLRAIDYEMPVASAQVKSAILLAGIYADGETRISGPAPSRDHSERMLAACGVQVFAEGARTRLVPPRCLHAQRLEIPGDFSSAAFFIVAGLLGARAEGLLIRNVGLNPSRTGLLDILRAMRGSIEVLEARDSGAEPVGDLLVHRSELAGIVVPQDLVPLAIDELPVLAIAAACARGETLITGAAELRVKESDRIAAMSAGLAALGVAHEALSDGLRIEGRPDGPAFSGGEIESEGDHRIAMSFAVASLRASGAIRVADVANVATSFPRFLERARAAGLDIEEARG